MQMSEDPHARWCGEGARQRLSLPDFGILVEVQSQQVSYTPSLTSGEISLLHSATKALFSRVATNRAAARRGFWTRSGTSAR
jgi:hypothetical protein